MNPGAQKTSPTLRWVLGLGVVIGGTLLVAVLWSSIGTGPATVHSPSGSYVTDFTDDRRLVGWADNVFFGQVVEKTGETQDVPYPQRQFRVSVLESIKGHLAGEVVVTQDGGFDEEEGREIVVDGDPALQPGSTYLFVSRTDPNGEWQHIVNVFGDIRVESDLERAQLRERFRNAARNEVPFGAGR